MKSLYREYRPLRLDDVIGQEQVVRPLKESLRQGKIAHAYLFVGPRGCGKTSVARILAHEVNGFSYELEDNYVDIIEIDGASNRGIDDIRELREKASIAPTIGKYKIYIIDEVHMLTKEAFNALLKTLEEPPAHVIFIMATTDFYKVPPTITSRAQTYTFKLADHETMVSYLSKIAKESGISIEDGALDVIAKRGGGSFRDSLSLLDQISTLSEQTITREEVVSALGLPEDDKLLNLLSYYEKQELSAISDSLKSLLIGGVKPEIIVEEIIRMIVDRPSPALLPLLEKLSEIREPFIEAKLLVALTTGISASARLATPTTKSVQPSTPTRARATTPEVALAPEPRETKATKAVDKPSPDGLFDWGAFLNEIESINEVIYKQLTKCEYEVSAGTLSLYPRTSIIKSILDKPNNKQIIIDHALELKIVIHEAGEHPVSAKKDSTLSKISDIMGGEVINYEGGSNPF